MRPCVEDCSETAKLSTECCGCSGIVARDRHFYQFVFPDYAARYPAMCPEGRSLMVPGERIELTGVSMTLIFKRFAEDRDKTSLSSLNLHQTTVPSKNDAHEKGIDNVAESDYR